MTDVHFRPAQELVGTGSAYQTNTAGTTTITGQPLVHEEHNAGGEMAAFERGRMQGEMEAIRRLESEQNAMVLKQFPAEPAAVILAPQPDVVEINRLTWPQRLAVALGEGLSLAFVAMTIAWCEIYHGEFGWTNSTDGDAEGNINMWNTMMLTQVLGLFFLAQAILLYRVLPLRTPAFMNRVLYTFNYSAAMTCFSLALAAMVMTNPSTNFWGADHWCYALAFAVVGAHYIYSMIQTWLRPRHVDYEHWAETNNHVTHSNFHQSPEQRRDHSLVNEAGRSVYAPQPHFQGLKQKAAAHANTHIPTAPANAPRWAELPQHHQEDYFLVPRAKWAVCGYFAMGASILMFIIHTQYSLASSSRSVWPQNGPIEREEPLGQSSREARLLSATALILLGAVLAIAYAAMPPRTTLVKNAALNVADGRRASVSHNAETRLGHHDQNIV